jgi:predicted nuclease of predicted toxin-antitoxin system
MRFLSDENFRRDVVGFLQRQGHDVKIIPRNSSDKTVAILAKKEKRIILTNDGDFSVSLQFPPHDYYGILVFRIHPPRFERFKIALENFFALYSAQFIKGKTFIIEETSFLEIE